ncbi:MAG: SRPBCC family protein [Planctomycetaceae bacterium]
MTEFLEFRPSSRQAGLSPATTSLRGGKRDGEMEPAQHCHRPESGRANVGDEERLGSLVVGGGLLLYGLLGRSLKSFLALAAGGALIHRGWTGRCKLYESLGMDTASAHHDSGVRAQRGRKVTWSLHINRDSREVYDYWRNLQNLPRVMRHLESVMAIDGDRSHWIAKAPLGHTLEWDAEIITDEPGRIIAWQSLPDSEVDTAGSVRFETPAFGEGCELSLSLKYDPPGGKAVAALAHLVGQGLEQDLREDLRKFKQVMEAGEVTSAATRPLDTEG